MKSLYMVSHDNDDSSEAFYCDMNLKTRVIELISLFWIQHDVHFSIYWAFALSEISTRLQGFCVTHGHIFIECYITSSVLVINWFQQVQQVLGWDVLEWRLVLAII